MPSQVRETWVGFLLLIGLNIVVADDSCPGLPKCFCNNEKTSVNCEGKQFTTIPENIPTSVVKLYLGSNQISKIDSMAFSSFPKLEKLYLQQNEINTIGQFGFGNTSIVELDIRGNKLTSLGKNAFSGMKSLRTLYLITNQIEEVDSSAFDGSEMVEYIYLQSNMLEVVPQLGKMPNLKMLILVGNKIVNATFPETYQSVKGPFEIGLSDNNIQILENKTFEALQNKSISSLYLSKNAITNVETGVFAPLGSIQSLKLGTNPLHPDALRSAISGLQGKNMASLDISGLQLNGILLENTFQLLRNTSITSLNMRSNNIQTLPDNAFVGLNKLLHLDLTSCNIRETSSDSFAGLDKLTILILNKNNLNKVPSNLPNALEHLFLDDNQLTGIPSKALGNLGYLQELRIRYNKLLTLEQDAFYGLSQLNKLSLYYNNIAILPGKIFDPLIRLVSLDLGHNNLASIQYVKGGRFSSLGSLVSLSLGNNKLSYLQYDTFKYTRSLKYLHLEHNLLGESIAEDYGGALFMGLRNLEELHLEDNNIKALPDPAFKDLSSLKFLNLTSNKLTGWGAYLFKSTQKLQGIDLTNNIIATIKQENVQDFPGGMSLNLTNNPFECNCDLRWFRDWLGETSVILTNKDSYRCNGPNSWSGKPLLSFDRSKIDCKILKWWYILIGCSAVLVLALIISGLLYRKRWWIKLSIYKMTRKTQKRKLVAADGHGAYGAINPDDDNPSYDAYISCAEENKAWVLKYLLPGIDRGKIDDDQLFGGQYSLYFEDRDSLPGRSDAGNIFENMQCSRKMLLVLSEGYLQSPMHMFEFDLAIRLMYEGTLEEIVVIDIEQGLPQKKIPKQLEHTMKRNKVIEWSSNEDAQVHFIHKINDILAKTAVAAEHETV